MKSLATVWAGSIQQPFFVKKVARGPKQPSRAPPNYFQFDELDLQPTATLNTITSNEGDKGAKSNVTILRYGKQIT
jgi:hypothetical protein